MNPHRTSRERLMMIIPNFLSSGGRWSARGGTLVLCGCTVWLCCVVWLCGCAVWLCLSSIVPTHLLSSSKPSFSRYIPTLLNTPQNLSGPVGVERGLDDDQGIPTFSSITRRFHLLRTQKNIQDKHSNKHSNTAEVSPAAVGTRSTAERNGQNLKQW